MFSAGFFAGVVFMLVVAVVLAIEEDNKGHGQ